MLILVLKFRHNYLENRRRITVQIKLRLLLNLYDKIRIKNAGTCKISIIYIVSVAEQADMRLGCLQILIDFLLLQRPMFDKLCHGNAFIVII